MSSILDQFKTDAFPEDSEGGEVAGPVTPAQSVWFLAGRSGPNEPIQHVAIDSDPFVVGRNSNLSLSLQSRTVSSVHAELTDAGATLWLQDIGSTNGTYVNGQRVTAPVDLNTEDLVQFGDVPFRVLRQTATTRAVTESHDVCDQALALVQFDRLMSEKAVVAHYQPIVRLDDQQPIGHEVLGRSRIPSLESPAAMFNAAAQLNLETQLSQMFRWKAIEETMTLTPPPHLFLNTHPVELEQPGLIESMAALRKASPAQSITLEIHEAAMTDSRKMSELRAALQDLDIALAFDDFGAGQTRLAELAEVHPEYVKFDISLIREIHLASDERRHMVGALVQMVQELGVTSLAEGIETADEFIVCADLGFELAQGFYFGKPFPLRR